MQLDVVKLILLAVAISMPILLLNLFVTAVDSLKKEVQKEKEASESENDPIEFLTKVTFLACLITNFIFGLSVYCKLFLNFNLKINMIVVGMGQTSWAVYSLLGYGYVKIKKIMKDKRSCKDP